VDISARPDSTQFSAEHCDNIRKALTGRTLSAEHRARIGAAVRETARKRKLQEESEQQ